MNPSLNPVQDTAQNPVVYEPIERLFSALERLEYSASNAVRTQENEGILEENAFLMGENNLLKARIFELEQQYNALHSVTKTISDKLDSYTERLAQILEE